jgi:copper chaperone
VLLDAQRELVDAQRTLNDLERDARFARFALEQAMVWKVPLVQRSASSTSPANFRASVVVHTPGEYSSTKEIRMNTTTETNKSTTLSIEGMTCGHCVQAVTKALSAVPGVKVTSVTVGSAVIEASDGWAAGKAVTALGEAGYPARAAADVPVTAVTAPVRSGGGCCGGAKNAMPGSAPSAKTSGGCCG